jgi:hypothetical protein
VGEGGLLQPQEQDRGNLEVVQFVGQAGVVTGGQVERQRRLVAPQGEVQRVAHQPAEEAEGDEEQREARRRGGALW